MHERHSFERGMEALGRDVSFLGRVLGDVLREQGGEDLFQAVEGLRQACREVRHQPSEAATTLVSRLVDDLSLERAAQVVRAFTMYFHLINMAEENHRLRRIEQRDNADPRTPRDESIGSAIQALHDAGAGADEVDELLGELSIQPVFTAHPTEARRMTVLQHLRRVAALVHVLGDAEQHSRRRERLVEQLYAEVTNLWQTNELRTRQQSVLDEVENGLYYVDASVFDTVAVLYRDLHDALARCYPSLKDRHYRFLTLGSWIGGDRDGNPNCTSAITERALRMHRALALRRYIACVTDLLERLSSSLALVDVSTELLDSLQKDVDEFEESEQVVESRSPTEPYRQKLAYVRRRLQSAYERNGVSWTGRDLPDISSHGGPTYADSGPFLEDLTMIACSLRQNGGTRIAREALQNLIWQVQVFGFHLVTLDIRQHRNRHLAALDEILAAAGVCDSFSSLSESARQAALERAMDRDLSSLSLDDFSDGTRETLETCRLVARMQDEMGPEATNSYIVSFTRDVSDLLAVLLLARIVGLFDPDQPVSHLRIVPLFETEDDLARAPGIMRRLFAHPLYRVQLTAWNDRQEVMIGYSDSDKDAGYVSSNWWLYRAQQELTRVGDECGVTILFFHGRGGAIGRGGGPLHRAILGQPAGTMRGQIKVTEQGEVLFTRYANPAIAHRHLEQVVNAVVRAGSPRLRSALQNEQRWEHIAAGLSEHASRAYRDLVSNDPRFVEFFDEGTPLRSIMRLRMASRPAKRSAGALNIEDLRAIPWVFAWTQSRYGLPGWYGLGSALGQAIENGAVDDLRTMYREWPFFRWLLDAAQISLGKADLGIARRYSELVQDPEVRVRYSSVLDEEFEKTITCVNSVVGQEKLLDSWPLLQRSIALRNPYVDPMSYVQVRAIREVRTENDENRAELLRSIIDRSVTGIAAGLQNTG
ncbi:MAG: phosphoenolpyruvate carboxylase [Chloroflexota bacterium]